MVMSSKVVIVNRDGGLGRLRGRLKTVGTNQGCSIGCVK